MYIYYVYSPVSNAMPHRPCGRPQAFRRRWWPIAMRARPTRLRGRPQAHCQRGITITSRKECKIIVDRQPIIQTQLFHTAHV